MDSKTELTLDQETTLRGISALFNNSKYADVFLRVSGVTFPAHKAIISNLSAALQTACDQIEVGGHIEVTAGAATPNSVYRLLQHGYTHDYEEFFETERNASVIERSRSSSTDWVFSEGDSSTAGAVTPSSGSTSDVEDHHELPKLSEDEPATVENDAEDTGLEKSDVIRQTLLNNVHVYALTVHFDI